MATRHVRYSPIGDYMPLHISSIGTAIPVGQCVSTTSSTTITAGAAVTVTPASLANIRPGMRLNFAHGTGTAEDIYVISVDSVGGTFTANFANNHSGAYTIISYCGSFLGRLTINQAGDGTTITLYNGHPSISPAPTTPGFGIVAVIQPGVANTPLEFGVALDFGLFYTVATTGSVGDYTLMYADQAA